MSEFPSLHHVAITVTDLEASREWYRRLLGTEAVLDEPVPPLGGHHHGFHHVVFALPGGVLFALHAHGATDRSQLFDELRPGLDDVSFGCANRDRLEQWQARLEELGIKHGGIAQDANGCALSFRDPDDIALELWAPCS